jgi:tetratricopeptide (TPR) repeat protein
LPQPSILGTPFSSLKETLESIVDIEEKEHYKDVKIRLEIAKKNVTNAIGIYEKGEVKPDVNVKEEIDIDLLKKEIIGKMFSDSFNEEEIENLYKRANKVKDEEVNGLMASLYFNMAISIHDKANTKTDENLLQQRIRLNKSATVLNPKYDSAFNNWGSAISDLARMKNDEELFMESIEKFRKATEINPNNSMAFYNWGGRLLDLGKLKNDESMFREGLEKAQRAVELGYSAYNLACAYALLQDKTKALSTLETSLSKKKIAVAHVENDEDWKSYWEDEDFKALLAKYR